MTTAQLLWAAPLFTDQIFCGNSVIFVNENENENY